MKRTLTIFLALTTALALGLGAAGCSSELDPAAGPLDSSAEAPSTTASSTSTTGEAATGSSDTGSADTAGESGQEGTEEVVTYPDALTLAYDDNDLDAAWSESKASFITLADGSIRFDGAGAGTSADAENSKVTITAAGTYVVSGTVSDGQIVVDVEETGPVRLVLNGADITCSSSAPIYIKNAEKVILVLADGTENVVSDGGSYVFDDEESDEPNAAIFSKTDLTINGSGSLTVKAIYNDGITSKDDLKILSGDITVEAANDAIKGKDSLGIKEAAITITAGGDGLQASNDTEADKGFVCISGGAIDITAGSDGIQAETTLLVSAGDLSVATGGGSANAPSTARGFGTTQSADTSGSAKGLKAGGGVFVDGGTIDVDSSDDAVHSNNTVELDGGALTLASGDDGIHADASVELNGGRIDISKSYEGIEANSITLRDGTAHVVSRDDGLNGVASSTASATTGAATGGTGWGQGQGGPGFWESGDARLVIEGGYMAVDAGGDGMDINGGIQMSGGVLIINGPTESMNGAVDYYSEFTVTGGFFIAVGSAGMAQAPSDSSTQYSVMVNFDRVQAAGTIVHVQAEDGSDILTFAPTKQYQSLVLSSPDLKEGMTYTVYLGGSSTGVATDSLYADGVYSPGEEYASLALSGVVTASGAGGMMPGMPGGGMSGGGMQGGGMRPGGGTRPGGVTPPDGDVVPGAGTPPTGDTTATTLTTF